jgi:hypothetical protein
MLNATQAADMAINGDVVGRIGEDKFRLCPCQELIVCGLVTGIPAQEATATEQPQIAGLADRRTGWLGHRIFRPARIAARLARLLQEEVDFGHLEAGRARTGRKRAAR